MSKNSKRFVVATATAALVASSVVPAFAETDGVNPSDLGPLDEGNGDLNPEGVTPNENPTEGQGDNQGGNPTENQEGNDDNSINLEENPSEGLDETPLQTYIEMITPEGDIVRNDVETGELGLREGSVITQEVKDQLAQMDAEGAARTHAYAIQMKNQNGEIVYVHAHRVQDFMYEYGYTTTNTTVSDLQYLNTEFNDTEYTFTELLEPLDLEDPSFEGLISEDKQEGFYKVKTHADQEVYLKYTAILENISGPFLFTLTEEAIDEISQDKDKLGEVGKEILAKVIPILNRNNERVYVEGSSLRSLFTFYGFKNTVETAEAFYDYKEYLPQTGAQAPEDEDTTTGDTGSVMPPSTGDTGNTTTPPSTGDTGNVTTPPSTGDTGNVTTPPSTGDTGNATTPPSTGDTGNATTPPPSTGDTGNATTPPPSTGNSGGSTGGTDTGSTGNVDDGDTGSTNPPTEDKDEPTESDSNTNQENTENNTDGKENTDLEQNDLAEKIKEIIDSLLVQLELENNEFKFSLDGTADDLRDIGVVFITEDGMFVDIDGVSVKISNLGVPNIENKRVVRVNEDGSISTVMHYIEDGKIVLTTSNLEGITIMDKVDEPFEDVDADAWYFNDIEEAFNLGLIKGTTANSFNPNSDITRGEFATMVARVLDGYELSNPDTLADLDGKWYAEDVQKLMELGIIHGHDDGTFGGDEPLTREQAITIMGRLLFILGIDTGHAPEANVEDLEDVSDWAKQYVNYFVANDVLVSGDGVSFNPKDEITRAEMAKVLVRAIKLSYLY